MDALLSLYLRLKKFVSLYSTMIVNSFPFSSHNSYLLSMTKQYCIQFFVHSNCGECIPDFGCSKFVTGLIGDVKFVLNVGIS